MNETTVFKELPVEVGPLEMLEFGKKLSHQINTVGAIQAAKAQSASEFKSREQEAQAAVVATAQVISTGIEYRKVECYLCYDHRRGIVETFRSDTAELVDARPMTTTERQRAIVFPEPDESEEQEGEEEQIAVEPAPNPEPEIAGDATTEDVAVEPENTAAPDAVKLSLSKRG